MVVVDPNASLEICDIELTLGGVDYLMRGRPAADWLVLLFDWNLNPVVPGWLDPDDENAVIGGIEDELISAKEIEDVTWDVVSAAAGRPWWWAMQLIRYAGEDIHRWSRVSGRLILAGVDPVFISLAAWVDAVYVVLTDKLEVGSDEYKDFMAAIDTPPTVELLDEDEEAAAFLSMMG